MVDVNIESNPRGAKIDVLQLSTPTPTPWPTPTPTFPPSPTLTPWPTSTPTFPPSPTPTPTPQPTRYPGSLKGPCPPLGDVLGDGYIGIDDFNAMIDHITDKRTLTSEQLSRGKVSTHNSLNVNATFIHSYLQYKIFRFELCKEPILEPIILPIVTNSDLVSFRKECIRNDNVKVSFDILEPWLESRKIAAMWYDLNVTEKRNLMNFILNEILSDQIIYVATGKDKCMGRVTKWVRANCVDNALIRYAKFKRPVYGMDRYYYSYAKYSMPITSEVCVYTTNYYGLPCYYTRFNTPSEAIYRYDHAVMCVKLKKNPLTYTDFYYFQYNLKDTKPWTYTFVEENGLNIVMSNLKYLTDTRRMGTSVEYSYFIPKK